VPEQRQDRALDLVELTGMSLKDLAELDDVLLEGSLERLLPSCGGLADRLWQNYAQPPC
jgi:hypothetical protein